MGFSGSISLEAAALGKALLTGVFLGVYYDLFRILRRVFHFGYAMILGQDLLFWITGAVGVFFGSVVAYGGRLRILFVVAALTGWAIYAATVGNLLMSVVDFVLNLLRRVLSFLYRHTLRPLLTRSKAAAEKLTRGFRCRISGFFADFRKKREKYARNRKNTA